MKAVYQFFVLVCVVTSMLLMPVVASAKEEKGHLVPLFTLKDQHGNDISLEQQRGKVVMINFWATWCPPCIKELPTMVDLKNSFGDRPFEILAVNMGEESWVVEQFIDNFKTEFNFPLLTDTAATVASKYKVSGLPATMLIDTQGRFVFGGVGERDWNEKAVKAEILTLFD